MYQTTVTEDRREIFTVLKAFLAGQYDAKRLLYSHVSYTNIEGSKYNVTDYEDELSFTKSGRIWLVRRLENFNSDFELESMENIKRRIFQGCIKADDYIKELCEFPINGELTIIREVDPNRRS